MHTLDQSKPYAEVHGLPGAMYEQNGALFKGNGMEAFPSDVEHIIDDIAIEDSNDPLPYLCCVEQSSESPVIVHAEEGRDLGNMHWRHLKALVEVYGETWENKEKAIAFLKGKA